ncbi:MAG: hypothetical protein OER96_12515 [Gammaproteobacteria bacterium]|nr:hypothetical protein [Gammaproteobacteria bacterium]
MCVKSTQDFEITPHLEQLTKISRESKEYQGHGWGCAWVEDGVWRYYHNIDPIWQHDLKGFGKTTLLLAHARSAFRDEGITIENNMPFHDNRYAFIFNGELQGVRIKEQGRIGAEKIFNYIRRFDKGDMLTALTRAVGVINKKTRYVRAMNLVLADTNSAWLASGFNEDPNYFQMHKCESKDMKIVSSLPYADGPGWQVIPNSTIERV